MTECLNSVTKKHVLAVGQGRKTQQSPQKTEGLEGLYTLSPISNIEEIAWLSFFNYTRTDTFGNMMKNVICWAPKKSIYLSTPCVSLEIQNL